VARVSFSSYNAVPRSATLGRRGARLPASRWFCVALLVTLIDGKLLLALVLGHLTHSVLASGRPVSLPQLSRRCQRWLASFGRLARTPLGAGTLAFGTTYSLAIAWTELDGNGAAIVLVGLGLMNGAFWVREIASGTRPPASDASRLGVWHELSSPIPSRRLVAVQTLVWAYLQADHRLPKANRSEGGRSHLIDCLQAMLTQEVDPVVQRAVQEGLQILQPAPQLPAGPTMIPVGAIATAPTYPRPSTVEYVEP
jgi:hypothetical protein